MSAANGGEATQGTATTEEKYSGIWGLLPSFDPTTDDPREYKDKVTFLHQICPQKDRTMLAPRLAMQCKGTAWAQVKSLDATTLTDPVNGVKALLLALSSWDEAAELQTYEKFEKALFRVQQRSDETTMSYVNRLAVAFNEIGGELTIKEVKAFIMLKQSALSSEDKRKVITLAGGSMDANKVEQAMRTLSTKILTSPGEAKKKVYPVNYVEEDMEEVHAAEDENLDDEQFLQQLVDQGDEDANFVADYEDQILDMVQELPEMAECFNAYVAARNRLREKARNRGFWPPRAKGGKGGKGGGKKGGRTSIRRTLAERIASSHCRICGQKGHWRMECPQRASGSQQNMGTEVSNFASPMDEGAAPMEVITEVPHHTMSLAEMMIKHGSYTAQSLIKRMQTQLMSSVRLQETVDMHSCFETQHESLRLNGQRLISLCVQRGKLRAEAFSCERACFVDRAELAILDTGASRTVVGKDGFRRFTEQLPPQIRRSIRTMRSKTVFRFGNNGTLPSLFAACIPFDGKCWMKVEVVDGRTPFLLSNALLRQLGCHLDFQKGRLWIPEGSREVKLTTDAKGLYLVDVRELLRGGPETVCTVRDEGARERESETRMIDEILPDQAEKGQGIESESFGTQSHEAHQPALPRPGTGSPGGPRPQPSSGQSRLQEAPGDSNSSRMGGISAGRRKVLGQAFSGGDRARSRVRQVYQKSRSDRKVVDQLPELHPGNGGYEREDLLPRGDDRSTTIDEFDGISRSLGTTNHVQDRRTDERSDTNHSSKFGDLVRDEERSQTKSELAVGGQHGAGSEPRPCTGDSDTNGGPSARTGQNVRPSTERGLECQSETRDQDRLKTFSDGEVAAMLVQLDARCLFCERSLTQMHINKKAPAGQEFPTESDLLEVLIGDGTTLIGTGPKRRKEVSSSRYVLSRGQLFDETAGTQLWKKMARDLPTHVFFRVGLQTVSPAEAARIASICTELYFAQVALGKHFHMCVHSQIEKLEAEALTEVQSGTLLTNFDVSSHSVPVRLKGNPHFRQKVQFRTTSRQLHETMDARYFHEDRLRMYFGHPVTKESFHQQYVLGFARNFLTYVRGRLHEDPVPLEEYCAAARDSEERKSLQQEGMQVLKRRRMSHKQSPKSEYEGSRDTWTTILQKLGRKVPRVGNYILDPNDGMIQTLQLLLPEMKVHHAEACRGINRLRTPILRCDPEKVEYRKTIVVNRNNGEVEEVGGIEHWAKLPRYKQIRSGKPARVALTVFGSAREGGTSQVQEERVLPEPLAPETDTLPNLREPTPVSLGTPKEAWGPPPVANHGPGFLRLQAQEQAEIRRLHHNLGHPDTARFVKYLQQGDACPEVIEGAKDFQCDACVESRKGYSAPRPGNIHANLAFNTKVGIDCVTWKNSAGQAFHFVHFIDEGTMFHLGAECGTSAREIIDKFEDIWINWAGAPSEVYVDPGGEFVSEEWTTKMQEYGCRTHVSAGDSHWQLGRAEIHGYTVKRMLTRMDLESPIGSSVDFRNSLRQAFAAKNTLSRADGYTPQQSVLGIASRLPGSITSDDGTATHALADSDAPEGQRFLQSLQTRERARRAFIKEDNSASFRRAILRRTRPIRVDWEPGDYVLYWRRKGANLRREHGRWHGPGQVVSIEKNKVVWISHQGRLVRASPEQVRAASLREWQAVPKDSSGVPLEQATDLKERLRNSPQYLDIESEERPQTEDYEMESIPEPERENAPESDALLPSESTEETSVVEPRSETLEPQRSNDDSQMPTADVVPLPDDASEGLEWFGDDVEMESAMTCDAETCWEIDITPAEGWSLPASLDEEMIYLASESRKKKVEVKLRELTVKDQRRFAAAKNKEVNAWISHKTVRRVAGGKIPERNIMRCRWIYTWKTADANSAEAADGRKAKARLVVLGFEDPDIDVIHNDAPTLSKDGRHLILQKVASNRWELCSFDISTAFLHGKGDGRTLGIQAPDEIREALQMGESDQCALEGGAYGRIDAPYLWYQELRSELIKIGFRQCPLDPCVFSLYSKGKCHGVLGIHVDDGIAGGDEIFHGALEKLRTRFSFGSFEKRSFVFTGIRLHQWDDFSIEVDQVDYVEKIESINVPRDRRRNPEDAVSEAERRALRQIIGSLQYAAVHTRADICAKVGELQSAINQARVEHLLQANRVLQEAKQHPVSLMIVPIRESLLTFCAFSDASFSSVQRMSSHQGTIIFTTTPELLENNTTVVCPMAWSSKKIPRVVRSTLSAESVALSHSVDRLSWLRVFWAWLKNPDVKWQNPQELLTKEPTATAVTDCKSVYDIVSKTATPQCEEHRTTIECLLIRERMTENCKLRWVASGAMLADCLTKPMDAGRLRECLSSGRYSLFDESLVLQQRADKRRQLQWVRKLDDDSPEMPEKPSDRSEANCFQVQAGQQAGWNSDFWRLDRKRGILERIHRTPRWGKFTPIGVGECPVPFAEIGVQRTTFANTVSGKKQVSSDVWVGSSAYELLKEPWTGVTRFTLEVPKEQHLMTSL